MGFAKSGRELRSRLGDRSLYRCRWSLLTNRTPGMFWRRAFSPNVLPAIWRPSSALAKSTPKAMRRAVFAFAAFEEDLAPFRGFSCGERAPSE